MANPRVASPFVVYEAAEVSAAAVEREQRSIERDRGAIRIWHREVAEDLLRDPTDLELRAEEEVVALLLDRVERARIAA
jgi:hypothetical protein